MNIIESINQKAIFLNNLSKNEDSLFEYINTHKENLEEVLRQYKPEREFKPVNTLRFIIANELKKGLEITPEGIGLLKQALESRDVSNYYDLNDTVKQSLLNYKNSKKGMFPNWGHTFKLLFPFLYNSAENTEVNSQLEHLADEIIQSHQLENVTKHIVNFQGSQNYGSDHAWVAIIPKTAPSVQYAYQIFFTINKNGLVGGLHKGHNLTKQVFANQDVQFNGWKDYIEHIKHSKDEWLRLNSEVNFIFLNDEKAFVKALKKVDTSALSDYFKTLDRLKEDLDIQDEEKLVFSIAKSQLSFHVGKRYCLNVNKNLFDFISYNELEGNNTDRETFTGSDIAYLYKNRTGEEVSNYYEDIKSAIETEVERDNHTVAKSYDNSAFRKAVFDKEYRRKFFIGDISSDRILLNGQKIYKISMGKDHFNNEAIEEAIKKGLVLVHSQTKPKGRSNISQADIFSKEMNIGDYFYLTHSNENIKLIGKITTASQMASFRDLYDEGWLERSFETVSLSNKKGSFTGSSKYWTPNTNVTCWQINEDEIQEANRVLFMPYFNIEFKMNDMENKFEDFLKLSLAIGTVKTYLSAIRSIEKLAKNEGLKLNSIYEFNDVDNFRILWNQIRNIESYVTTNDKHHNRFSSALLKYEEFLEYLKLKPEIPFKEYKAPLNQIFYGPPGTGKTYNTILEAAKIITQNEAISYDDAKMVFKGNLGEHIEFITFHQNYSYEDFIQGLRPDTEVSGELSFFKSDGVFKRISDRALKNLTDSENPESVKKDFDKVFYELIKPLNEGNIEELEIKMKQTSFFITEVGEKSIDFRKNQGDSKHTLSISTLKKMYDSGFNDIILGGLQPYYNPILMLLLEKGKTNVVNVEKQNYVIIIDEINRANISRVFGELITLIEKDKRSHGKIPLTVTLPSGEQFIVPSNLYIIGTMNTADKSIALLDIALRRRFEFKAMYPKYEIPNKTIHKNEFLKSLNELIVKSGKGHDFTIGHSYFMCDEGEIFDFESTINNKVIPLMLEYYMNDEEEVKKIMIEALKNEESKVGNWPLELLLND